MQNVIFYLNAYWSVVNTITFFKKKNLNKQMLDIVSIIIIIIQALKEISELTDELRSIEDELDASESRLAEICLQLEEEEARADETER